MQRITGYNLVAAINQLPKSQDYNYINPSTKGLIRIVDVVLPEGPITTGVTSGLTRMLNFYNKIPPIKTRYVIVAPDEDRDHVVSEANKSIFRELDTRYFPYSSVEELFVICKRRKLRGITEEYLDCYMEPVVV